MKKIKFQDIQTNSQKTRLLSKELHSPKDNIRKVMILPFFVQDNNI